VAILYRGILLPYSSNDETIDFIYGVINWKEMADQLTADELLLEIDQALDLSHDAELAEEPRPRPADPLTNWADSPAHETAEEPAIADDLSLSDFNQFTLDDDEEYDEDEGDGDSGGYSFASLADYIEAPVKKAIDPAEFTFDPALDEAINDFAEDSYDEPVADSSDADFADEELIVSDDLPAEAGLYDCLASARELARTADTTEDRSRCALYVAVSRAYDFSLAAQAAPDDYAELIAESGLAVQDRAPMTPVVKLVFGHDYDKTRLTEYAAVLTHAHRLQLGHGDLAGFLAETDGGLKAVVKAERRLRREEQGKVVEDEAAVRAALAEKLRALEAMTLEALDGAGPEFALVLIRRDEIGCAELLAELPEDVGQIERAARKLVG